MTAMVPHCCEAHRRYIEAQGTIGGNRWPDDDIDWRSRKVSAFLVLLFFVGVILLIGVAGAQDIAGT